MPTRISTPRARSASRSPPAQDSTTASAVRPASASCSAAAYEPPGSGEVRRLPPPPAPRPTVAPSRVTANARVLLAPASRPTTRPLIRAGYPSRCVKRAGGDRSRGPGATRQRVRQARRTVCAEDRERERLAHRRRDAELVHRPYRDRRDRLCERVHDREVRGTAAGHGELAPADAGRRLARQRVGDHARRERDRGGQRVVLSAALLAHVLEQRARERRAELLAARALGRAPREVRVAERGRERVRPRLPAPRTRTVLVEAL